MTNYIYAYTTSGQQNEWKRDSGESGGFAIKVGQSRKAGLERIKEQLGTAFPGLNGVQVIFHSEDALRPDGSEFTDHDVHRELERAGIRRLGGEWFEANPDEIRGAVVSLQTGNPFSTTRTWTFESRPEQRAAVETTAAYFRANEGSQPKFLWNAKMRFGKTFATYELARTMGWTRVLVLTYKPAVRSAWRDDLLNHVNFVEWQFVDAAVPSAEADAVISGEAPVIWFASFQDVTGRDANGQVKAKNETIHLTEWDCIVIDEFHFGASTDTAREIYDPQDKESLDYARYLERATSEDDEDIEVIEAPDRGLKTKFHLHLSGTPFKAIAKGAYSEDQIFNWTYIDEQRAKRDWGSAAGPNPYVALPQMQMFTYTIGDFAMEVMNETQLTGFDLNVYFKARRVDGKAVFDHPDNIRAFLDLIRGKKHQNENIVLDEKLPFPYEAERFSSAVQNSIWYLPDVASCEAMGVMLENDPFFSKFVIHVAAGKKAGVGAGALFPLKRAMKEGADTFKSGSITLTCGKLMTGITVPEWTSIFMLRSLKAPESYFPAAFRVQSPWVNGTESRREICYVFEFDPNRALGLLALYGTDLSNNTQAHGVTQASVLGELINFLPIFAIDGGRLEALDVDAILEWAHGGVTANSLARKCRSNDLYNLNGATMNNLLLDADLLSELEQIEDFRNIRELAEKIVSSENRIGRIQREGKPKSEVTKPKKALLEKRKSIREKLKKVSAKVLIFMYLTDFREERLMHVVESLDTELFLRSTGLSIAGFKKLTSAGVFNESQMNDLIQKYRYFERKSIEAMSR